MYLLARLLLLASLALLLGSGVALVSTFHPWSTILVVLFILTRLRRVKGLSLWGHGTARVATPDEMKKAGMI